MLNNSFWTQYSLDHRQNKVMYSCPFLFFFPKCDTMSYTWEKKIRPTYPVSTFHTIVNTHIFFGLTVIPLDHFNGAAEN